MNPSRIARRTVLALGGAAATLGSVASGGLPAVRADTADSSEAQLAANQAAFDEAWETVRDRFYDPRLHGVDWPAIRARYRPQAADAVSRDALAAVVNAMLSELGASHTQYYTPEETAYYQLADIFAGALRRRGLSRVFPKGEVSYPGIGVFTHTDDQGRTFITAVIDGTPAARAGLLLGDEILAADDDPFRPVASFRGKSSVSLSIRRHAGASPMTLEVAPAELHPNSMFVQGLRDSARLIPANGVRVGYVHVWSYAGEAYQRALEDLIANGTLREADALIWDLRDGWGGAQPQYLDLFNARGSTLRVTDRSGATEFDNVKWRKPVAMLVNGGTRSGKEVLAYGFKKYGLGEIIGTPTARAVLAASAFLMANGDLLLLAVDDVLVDDQRLEGVGVAPTIEVRFDPRYAAGTDPQLERAVQVLSRAGER